MIFRVRSLHHAYQGDPVLELDRLDVAEGARVGVLGPNGSGKTTLLEILAGLTRPTAGTVSLDGEPLGVPTSAEQRRRLGFMAQQPYPLPGTVSRNLMLAAPRGRSKVLRERLVADTIEGLGIGALLERRERGLSPGQLRRIALARVVVRDAEVLLLDEPYAFGDEALEAKIDEVLDAHCARGGTAIVASPRRERLERWATELVELGRNTTDPAPRASRLRIAG